MQIIPIQGLNALAWLMTGLAIVLTVGRFAIHWRKNRKIRWDDNLNGAALLTMIGFIITYQLYVPIEYNAELYALGLSDHAPTNRDIDLDMKYQMANILLFWLTIYLVKASFLALYWQIFEVSQGFRKAWGVIAAFTGLGFVLTLIGVFCHCGKPQDFLNLEACAARPRAILLGIVPAWCVINVVGDLLLIALPLAMLRPLQMQKSQKIGLAVVFGLVAIDIAFDVTRTVYTVDAYLSNFPDQNAIWAILEPTIAVIVCSLPCYRGLVARKDTPGSTTMVETYPTHASSKLPFSNISSDSGTLRSKSVPSEADGSKRGGDSMDYV